jgi:serine phosphatase RsbU (regulator of sigma subunit)
MSATSPAVPAERMRVLLIEDEDHAARIVEEGLAGSGTPVEIDRIHTLAEAAATHLARYDCVLLDLSLPDAAGLDGLARLRGLAPGLAVVVLTELDDQQRGVEAVAAGAQDYLLKGATTGVLLARSLRYAIERRRAELAQRQLAIARLEARENARLERGLLPALLVSDPSLSLATHYRPGRRRALLGGDFFDAVQAPDGTVHAVIGDVSGHGPDEAALGVCLRIAWRTLILAGAPPDRVLARLQEVLEVERHAPEVFTTACMISLLPRRSSVVVRLAGHPPPLMLVDGETVSLEPGPPGPPLGVETGGMWPSYDVALPPEWSLVLYTDGVMEGRAGDGRRRLGQAGLTAVVAAAQDAAGDDPGALVRLVVERAEQLNDGPLADDVALLLVARRSP